MSGSFESLRWKCMCAQTRPRFLLSSDSFMGMDSEPMLTPREKKNLHRKLRGGWNPRRCITQASESNKLPTELLRPLLSVLSHGPNGVCVRTRTAPAPTCTTRVRTCYESLQRRALGVPGPFPELSTSFTTRTSCHLFASAESMSAWLYEAILASKEKVYRYIDAGAPPAWSVQSKILTIEIRLCF